MFVKINVNAYVSHICDSSVKISELGLSSFLTINLIDRV